MTELIDGLDGTELDSETQLAQETRLADIAWFQALAFVGLGVITLFAWGYFVKAKPG